MRRGGEQVRLNNIIYPPSKALHLGLHFKLWLKLAKCGVTGKLLNLIKSMYHKLKSSVEHDGNFLDFFSCNIGLMQGESLSPFLYAMYVNDIEIELIKQECQSYELNMFNL